MQQLLWLETLLKLASGALLVLAPVTIIRLLGLPLPATGYWPRLLGAALMGIGAATYIEGAWAGSRGLGMAGIIAINIVGAAALAVAALFGGGALTRRGAFVQWSLVVALAVLVLFEIAHA